MARVELKIGDKVCIRTGTRFYGTDPSNPGGRTQGTVTKCSITPKDLNNLNVDVQWDSVRRNAYHTTDLELANKKPMATKKKVEKPKKVTRSTISVGDTVRIIKNTGHHYFAIGETGTVKATNPPKPSFIVVNDGGCWALKRADIKKIAKPKIKTPCRTKRTKTGTKLKSSTTP